MSEIEKIQRYIARTRMDKEDDYYLNLSEAMELTKAALSGESFAAAEIVNLAFTYGKAKGYRAAKAEQKAVAK